MKHHPVARAKQPRPTGEEAHSLDCRVGNHAPARGAAGTLGYLGILAADRGDAPAARGYYEASLALRRHLGDRWGIAASLNNLGLLALSEGNLDVAHGLLEESLAIRRELGDRRCIAVTLNQLGRLALAHEDPPTVRDRFAESLTLAREIGDRRSIAFSLEAFSALAAAEQQWPRAARLAAAASTLREAIHSPLPHADRAAHASAVDSIRAALGKAAFDQGWQEGLRHTVEEAVVEAFRQPVGATSPATPA